MKYSKSCPKCNSTNIAYVPDNAHRYLSNSIYITKNAFVERVPVTRYVCCDCGYVENWAENLMQLSKIKKNYKKI